MSERIGTARSTLVLVVVGQELSFVGCDIDSDRTIVLAPLAGQTEVQRLFYAFIPPAVPDDFALGHLPQEMGTASGGVLLFASDAKTGTHHAIGIIAALADPDAAQGGLGQAAVVLRELEMCL